MKFPTWIGKSFSIAPPVTKMFILHIFHLGNRIAVVVNTVVCIVYICHTCMKLYYSIGEKLFFIEILHFVCYSTEIYVTMLPIALAICFQFLVRIYLQDTQNPPPPQLPRPRVILSLTFLSFRPCLLFLNFLNLALIAEFFAPGSWALSATMGSVWSSWSAIGESHFTIICT